MFGFLKKIFGREEETKEERVAINDLDDWFSNKSKQILNELDTKIKIIKDKVSEEIEKTKQNLETLNNAELRNPKIPYRARQLMEGNREAYIKRVNIFLKQIDLEKDYDELLDFCNNFDNMLTDFGKSTIKTYHVLQEFFANESGAIARNIKNLDNLTKEIKEDIKNANIDSIKKIKEDISLLNGKIRQKESDQKELERKKKEREELIKLRNDIIRDIEDLKKDKEYEKLNKLEIDKDKIIRQINEHKNKLFHSFSVIETALKKFSRMAFENEKMIEKYLGNALFLLEDKELKVVSILKNLERNVHNNQVQLKDKKKEKTLEEIKKMNKEFFDDFLKKYEELKNGLNKINENIKKLNIQNKINILENRRKENESKLGNINKDIAYLKNNIEKENIDRLRERIEKEINNISKTRIIVS